MSQDLVTLSAGENVHKQISAKDSACLLGLPLL